MTEEDKPEGKIVGGKGITSAGSATIGDVSGQFAAGENINQEMNISLANFEKAIISGNILHFDNVNIDPKMIDVLAKKLIKLLNIDPKVVQATSVESLPPHIDEQIQEIDAAQSQIEDQGFSSTAETSYNLGMLEAYRRDYEKALAYFNSAVQKNPEYKQAHKSIARLQQHLATQEIDENKLNSAINRLNSARSAVDVLLQLDPLDTDTLALRGYIYKTLGQLSEAQGKIDDRKAHFTEAARMFEHLLLLDPTNASAQNGWGNIQYTLGNLDAAIAAYSRAIELSPKYTAAFHDLALAYEQKMEADRAHAKKWCREALKAWRRAYELAPEDSGFTPYNILTIGQQINWLERKCSLLM